MDNELNNVSNEGQNNEVNLSLNEVSFGKIHKLSKAVSSTGDETYRYKGRLHQSQIKFYYNGNITKPVPVVGNGDYGYTLEGKARELFTYEDAFVTENKAENKLFIYINDNSKLFYNGSFLENYNFFFKVFKEEHNQSVVRWITITAEPIIN